MESLGVEELKYILTMLLSYTDYEGTGNPADVILLFMTRKYSHTAHMKKKSNIEEELKYILTMLLSYTDYEGTGNPADVILLFMTRKYSHTAHMKKKSNIEQRFPQFSATNTFLEAVEKCNVLLGELKELQEETEQLEKYI